MRLGGGGVGGRRFIGGLAFAGRSMGKRLLGGHCKPRPCRGGIVMRAVTRRCCDAAATPRGTAAEAAAGGGGTSAKLDVGVGGTSAEVDVGVDGTSAEVDVGVDGTSAEVDVGVGGTSAEADGWGSGTMCGHVFVGRSRGTHTRWLEGHGRPRRGDLALCAVPVYVRDVPAVPLGTSAEVDARGGYACGGVATRVCRMTLAGRPLNGRVGRRGNCRLISGNCPVGGCSGWKM